MREDVVNYDGLNAMRGRWPEANGRRVGAAALARNRKLLKAAWSFALVLVVESLELSRPAWPLPEGSRKELGAWLIEARCMLQRAGGLVQSAPGNMASGSSRQVVSTLAAATPMGFALFVIREGGRRVLVVE